MISTTDELAIYGGPKVVQIDAGNIFKWPIVTQEDEEAVLDVLRRGAIKLPMRMWPAAGYKPIE